MAELIDKAREKLQRLKANKEALNRHYIAEMKKTFRERVGKERELIMREHQKEVFMKRFKSLENKEELFNEFFDMLMDEKVKNMIEYGELKELPIDEQRTTLGI